MLFPNPGAGWGPRGLCIFLAVTIPKIKGNTEWFWQEKKVSSQERVVKIEKFIKTKSNKNLN